MKKKLIEELRRIYEITYKDNLLSEDFINSLISKTKQIISEQVDVDSKADLVTPNVDDFYNTLESAINSGGLSQQKKGSMSYQKEVESLQIALVLLGYSLPKHGIDGLFGPETASAIEKFKNDHQIMSESAESLRSDLDSLGYEEKGDELTSGGEVSDAITNIVGKILSEFKRIDPNTIVTVTSGNDQFHKGVGYASTHSSGQSIDVTLTPYNDETSTKFKQVLDRYKSDPKFKYIDEYLRPSGASTGGHFHLEYDDGTVQPQQNTQRGQVAASPEVISAILNLLKSRNITPEQISPYLDPVDNTTGSKAFTEIDLQTNEGINRYAEICDKFISGYKNPLGITGNMLASGAAKAFRTYGRYVPPELSLAQLLLEGGINSDETSRPVRTKNPYNVGNVDSGSNRRFGDVQDSIDAYYKLIASKYIGKGKSINSLLTNFVNKRGERYASSQDYENKLASITQKVNNIANELTA